MQTPHTQRPRVPSPRYGQAIPPLRPQQSFPQPPPYERPTSYTTNNYRVLTPHPGSGHEPQHTKYTQFVLHQYRLHSHLLVTQRALHDAHSPHPLVQKEIPLRRHKASPTGHRDQISDSTSSRTLLELTLSKEFMCQSALITPLPHLNILSSQQQFPVLWGNSKMSMFRKDGIETSHSNACTFFLIPDSRNDFGTCQSISLLWQTA